MQFVPSLDTLAGDTEPVSSVRFVPIFERDETTIDASTNSDPACFWLKERVANKNPPNFSLFAAPTPLFHRPGKRLTEVKTNPRAWDEMLVDYSQLQLPEYFYERIVLGWEAYQGVKDSVLVAEKRPHLLFGDKRNPFFPSVASMSQHCMTHCDEADLIFTYVTMVAWQYYQIVNQLILYYTGCSAAHPKFVFMVPQQSMSFSRADPSFTLKPWRGYYVEAKKARGFNPFLYRVMLKLGFDESGKKGIRHWCSYQVARQHPAFFVTHNFNELQIKNVASLIGKRFLQPDTDKGRFPGNVRFKRVKLNEKDLPPELPLFFAHRSVTANEPILNLNLEASKFKRGAELLADADGKTWCTSNELSRAVALRLCTFSHKSNAYKLCKHFDISDMMTREMEPLDAPADRYAWYSREEGTSVNLLRPRPRPVGHRRSHWGTQWLNADILYKMMMAPDAIVLRWGERLTREDTLPESNRSRQYRRWVYPYGGKHVGVSTFSQGEPIRRCIQSVIRPFFCEAVPQRNTNTSKPVSRLTRLEHERLGLLYTFAIRDNHNNGSNSGDESEPEEKWPCGPQKLVHLVTFHEALKLIATTESSQLKTLFDIWLRHTNALQRRTEDTTTLDWRNENLIKGLLNGFLNEWREHEKWELERRRTNFRLMMTSCFDVDVQRGIEEMLVKHLFGPRWNGFSSVRKALQELSPILFNRQAMGSYRSHQQYKMFDEKRDMMVAECAQTVQEKPLIDWLIFHLQSSDPAAIQHMTSKAQAKLLLPCNSVVYLGRSMPLSETIESPKQLLEMTMSGTEITTAASSISSEKLTSDQLIQSLARSILPWEMSSIKSEQKENPVPVPFLPPLPGSETASRQAQVQAQGGPPMSTYPTPMTLSVSTEWPRLMSELLYEEIILPLVEWVEWNCPLPGPRFADGSYWKSNPEILLRKHEYCRQILSLIKMEMKQENFLDSIKEGTVARVFESNARAGVLHLCKSLLLQDKATDWRDEFLGHIDRQLQELRIVLDPIDVRRLALPPPSLSVAATPSFNGFSTEKKNGNSSNGKKTNGNKKVQKTKNGKGKGKNDGGEEDGDEEDEEEKDFYSMGNPYMFADMEDEDDDNDADDDANDKADKVDKDSDSNEEEDGEGFSSSTLVRFKDEEDDDSDMNDNENESGNGKDEKKELVPQKVTLNESKAIESFKRERERKQQEKEKNKQKKTGSSGKKTTGKRKRKDKDSEKDNDETTSTKKSKKQKTVKDKTLATPPAAETTKALPAATSSTPAPNVEQKYIETFGMGSPSAALLDLSRHFAMNTATPPTKKTTKGANGANGTGKPKGRPRGSKNKPKDKTLAVKENKKNKKKNQKEKV